MAARSTHATGLSNEWSPAKTDLTVQEADLPPQQTKEQQWFPIKSVLTDAPLTAGHRRAIEALAKK